MSGSSGPRRLCRRVDLALRVGLALLLSCWAPTRGFIPFPTAHKAASGLPRREIWLSAVVAANSGLQPSQAARRQGMAAVAFAFCFSVRQLDHRRRMLSSCEVPLRPWPRTQGGLGMVGRCRGRSLRSPPCRPGLVQEKSLRLQRRRGAVQVDAVGPRDPTDAGIHNCH